MGFPGFLKTNWFDANIWQSQKLSKLGNFLEISKGQLESNQLLANFLDLPTIDMPNSIGIKPTKLLESAQDRNAAWSLVSSHERGFLDPEHHGIRGFEKIKTNFLSFKKCENNIHDIGCILHICKLS